MIDSKELLKFTKNLSILFVEDDDALRVHTAETLSNLFKLVDVAADGALGLDKYKNNSYDLIITDINMPVMNGIELIQKIYEINSSQTVVVLSAYDDSRYLIPLVNLGVDKFIKKPIDYATLKMVLYNITKKFDDTSSSFINLGDGFKYDRSNKLLLNKDENIYLTKFEIIFLEQLTQETCKIYSNDEITSNFSSQNETIDSKNIRKLVSKLRKKIPSECLDSVYGIGYRILESSAEESS